MSKFPYLTPVLEWIPHILRSEYIRLLVANAHHASAVEVDVLDFLRASALVDSLLRLATIDVEGLSARQQLSVDEVVNGNLGVLHLLVIGILWYVVLACHVVLLYATGTISVKSMV